VKILLGSLDRSFSSSAPGENTLRRHLSYVRNLRARSPGSRVYVIAPGPWRPPRRCGRGFILLTRPRIILGPSLLRFGLRLKSKGLDVISSQSLRDDGWCAYLLKLLTRTPLLCQMHASSQALKGPGAYLSRILLRLADSIRVMTETAKRQLYEKWGIPLPKIFVVPVPIEPRKTALCDPTQNQILFVGRLSDEKNVDLLLEALKKTNKQIKCTIVGEGPNKNSLIRRSHTLGIDDRVQFLGQVSEDSLPGLYSTSTALVLPSKSESYGRVILQAFWCARPVIATQTEGASTLIENGKTGWIVKKGDSTELGRAISHASDDPGEAKRRGLNALRWVEHYSSKNHQNSLIDLWLRMSIRKQLVK